jgi:hypothetical protein
VSTFKEPVSVLEQAFLFIDSLVLVSEKLATLYGFEKVRNLKNS